MADEAPLVTGKSKRVWSVDAETCLVELIPSLSSFTHAREAVFPRTAELRLDFYELAAERFAEAGIQCVFKERIDGTHYLASWAPGPPFETIVKNYAVGSTLRKYPGLFEPGTKLRHPVVKFDYRCEPEDQPIPESYLRLLGCPVDDWAATALQVNEMVQRWLAPLVLQDFCLIFGVTPDGVLQINSEFSPDCMRLKTPDGKSMDKDLFRHGASEDEIVRSWEGLISTLKRESHSLDV